MNTEATSPHSLPAILFRERVMGDDGKPLADIPENWELADTREPELIELGRGQLLILSANDAEFAHETMLHTGNDDDIFIRAIFTPESSCPVYRMGDIVTVVQPDVGAAISYEVRLTHEDFPAEVLLSQDDFPPKLVQPGEMCLFFRPDLSLV
jgi:hypothetical protein